MTETIRYEDCKDKEAFNLYRLWEASDNRKQSKEPEGFDYVHPTYYDWAAACIAANIHITKWEQPLLAKNGCQDGTAYFEFQYKSRGNYVWGKSFIELVIREGIEDEQVCKWVYLAVKELRNRLEATDKGNYNYLMG